MPPAEMVSSYATTYYLRPTTYGLRPTTILLTTYQVSSYASMMEKMKAMAAAK